MIILSPTEFEIFTAINKFLTPLLFPTQRGASGPVTFAAPVLKGQVNRVPPAKEQDYVIMWPVINRRMAFNQDLYLDCVFTADIAGTLMTVSAVNSDFSGLILPGYGVFGVSVAADTSVVAQITGSPAGGVGTYTVTPSQTVASRKMAAGTQTLLQNVELSVQLDVHGPRAMDNANVISTVFLDSEASRRFDEMDPPVNMRPLYADEPRQLAFLNDSQQYENRYSIDAHFQVNQALTVPQQFADQLAVTAINVDVTYPPS